MGLLVSGCASVSAPREAPSVRAEVPALAVAPTSVVPTTTGPPSPATSVPPSRGTQPWPTDQKVLEPLAKITGQLAPKSVVASGTGRYFAQNMMYRHTVSVFDDRKQLLVTLPDAVDLNALGYENAAAGVYRGAPVEAAFTSDGLYAYVSNYRMYGPGYSPDAGSDSCERDEGQPSFVYRIDVRSLEIDRLLPVGPVPKFLAVTPDDRLLLVSNWCGFDVSVIDLATHETLAEVGVGRHPRGIAVTSDGATAYVAVMGSTDVAVIDLSAVRSGVEPPAAPSYLRGVGRNPRHLVLSPDDEVLYVSLSGEDAVVALDARTGQERLRAHTGRQPRSIDVSDDGTALYVVNYDSDTMTKVRTSDFSELQSFRTGERPIGITYDPYNEEVWVSAYSGTIHVYAERGPMCTAFGCAPPSRPAPDLDEVDPDGADLDEVDPE